MNENIVTNENYCICNGIKLFFEALNMALFICIVEVILIIIMSRRSKKISTDNFDNTV